MNVRRNLSIATAAAMLMVLALSGSLSGANVKHAASHQLAPVSVALDFVPNADNEGVFVAEKLGYFTKEGLKVTVIPYGQTPPTTLVAVGKSDFAIAATQALALFDFAAGDNVKAVFAVLQKTPTYYGYLASDTAVTSPKDLCGKTFGGFGYPSSTPVIQEMIYKAGGPRHCAFNTVTLGSSAYQAVDSGKVTFSIFFFSDIIEAQLHTHADLKWFRPTQYGLPNDYAAIFLGNDAWMQGHRKQATAFVQAIKQAYEYIEKNPAQGARIEAQLNPNAVYLPAAIKSSKVMAKTFLLSPTGHVGVMKAKTWRGFTTFLYQAGVLENASGQPLSSPLNLSKYWTNQYVNAKS
jgi:ABC-type nitrate/sulfonate/bicarbonate transport system substrate-binding protein